MKNKCIAPSQSRLILNRVVSSPVFKTRKVKVNLELGLTTAERMMEPSTQNIQNERGSFLTSTLVFMAMISVLMVSAWQIVTQRQDNWQKTKILNARDLVLTSALRNSRVATYYYYTILGNQAVNNDFIKCTMPGNPPVASKCKSKNPGTGALISHNVRLFSDNPNTAPVIGESAANAVHYDLYGRVCPTPKEDCPFDVYDDFTAYCAGGADTCDQPDYIQMNVHIAINPTVASHFQNLAVFDGTQKISIANYWDDYLPVLPPPVTCTDGTQVGAPITSGSGGGGWVSNCSGHGVAAPGAPGPAPASSGSPSPSCGNGRGGASCDRMHF